MGKGQEGFAARKEMQMACGYAFEFSAWLEGAG